MNVGLKLAAIAVLVLGVGWISYTMIQSGRTYERQKITIELQEKTNERKEIIRETIIDNRPVDNSDATDSLQFLRDRQGNR